MINRRHITRLITLSALLSVSLLINTDPVLALPLPKTLIEEIRLGSDTKIVNFHNIQDKAPEDARHLIVEIYTATSGPRADTIPVQLVFNYGGGGDYTNRVLSGEYDRLSTSLSESSPSAEILQLPVRLESKFGGSRAFIPWAFLDNQSKHVLSQSGVGGEYVASSMSHWDSLSAVNAISLRLDGDYKFSEGSLIQLYAVDEKYRVAEQVLNDEGSSFSFPELPQDKESLIVIGQTRANEVNPIRRGDRVWYSINGDKQNSDYQIQRLTGEAPMYDVLNLDTNKLLLDQMNEPRVGWNTAAEAPVGVFGPWVVHFSEYTNSNILRSFISLHGTRDSHYDPVGNEVGRWRGSENINSLDFFPQASSSFEEGSRVGVYNTKKSDIRHVVESEQSEVKIDLPDSFDSIELQINARSNKDDVEDDLMIELNDDTEPTSYLSQVMWALDGGGGALREEDNLVGVMPAGSKSEKAMSDISGTIKGLSGDDQAIIQAYGGIPGDGRVKSTVIENMEPKRISSVTFKTKSGENFTPGSVFSVWVEDPYSEEFFEGDLSDSLTWRSLLVIIFLSVVAIALGIYKYRQKTV